MRECAKLGCRDEATATAAVRYGERVVWICDLLVERDPNLIDLCSAHADSMTAPYGWTKKDDRTPLIIAVAVAEPVLEPVPQPTPLAPAS